MNMKSKGKEGNFNNESKIGNESTEGIQGQQHKLFNVMWQRIRRERLSILKQNAQNIKYAIVDEKKEVFCEFTIL